MDERENLPAKVAAQELTALTEKRGSLVTRGVAVLKKGNDALYRQARTVFDEGTGIRNWNAADDPAIFSAFKIFQRLADEKYGKAYYPLSILYSGRNEIEVGDSHAAYYTQLAFDWHFANQANQDAELWCDLGAMYQFGSGVEVDDTQAEHWYRKAAEQGYARGQWEFGSFLTFDSGCYWLELAAQQGNAKYQTNLADCYEFLSSQYQKAVYWYRMAAEQDDGWGQYRLGNMYGEGLGVDQNDELFVYWIRKAAEQGYALAQWQFGEMFANAQGVAQDNEQAEYWFRKAAEQDNLGTYQNNLGEMFIHGRGVAQDDEQAVHWFRKAANQGYADAQFNLGEMYLRGCGVAQDNWQAVHWFLEAAEQGQDYAQYNLGKMYQEGRGVEQDDDKAMYWYQKIHEQDYGDAGEWHFDKQDYEEYNEWVFNYDYWVDRFLPPHYFPDESLDPAPQDVVVFLTHTGCIKAQPLAKYLERPDNEGIKKMFFASTRDYILYFNNHGRAFKHRVHSGLKSDDVLCGVLSDTPIPELFGKTGEKIASIFLTHEFDDSHFVFMATASGIVKKTPLIEFSSPSMNGIIAIGLDEGDCLIGVEITDGQHDVMLFTDGGKAVRFDENDVRPMGRTARGVIGVKLAKGKKVISMLVAENETDFVLTATENGYGKRTLITEYTRHARATQGMIAIQTTERNGKVVAATLVTEDDEIMLITDGGVLIRTRVKEIRESCRANIGTGLIHLRENEKLSALEKLVKPKAIVEVPPDLFAQLEILPNKETP